jgi:hypothetical protein
MAGLIAEIGGYIMLAFTLLTLSADYTIDMLMDQLATLSRRYQSSRSCS